MQQTQIDFEKQQEHLKNVSRTFALTIPMLPESLIDYISNAYLLCRIADTVEDDPIAPTKQKIAWLVSFAQFCSNDFSDDMQLLSLHKQAVELVQKGSKTTEFELIKDINKFNYKNIYACPRIMPSNRYFEIVNIFKKKEKYLYLV